MSAVTAGNRTPLIELKDVVTETQGYEVLRGASCAFMEGRTTFIMGTPGAGKSTLIKAAAGLALPDSGTVLFRGKSIQSMGRRELEAFYFSYGFGFQDSALWANQSIYDNMALPIRVMNPRIGSDELGRLIRVALAAVDYRESLSERPSQLSSGEQKLVSIARAVATDPEILLLDEPMAFLNDAACQKVMDLSLDFKRRGKTVIVVSHSTYFAKVAADDLVIIHEGRTIARGEYEELLESEDPIVKGILRRSAQRERQAAGPLKGEEGETPT
jgi:phospholipid/cholesterol/gamma-HCH transport system ATP-binding protein